MNLKILINTIEVSYSCIEQIKEEENTITLTKINEQPIFILHKKRRAMLI